MGQAGLHYISLLALTVVALGNTVQAQPLKPPSSSEQALRKAAFEGQSEKVRSILDKGAKPDARDPDDRTALMMASFNGHKETVRLLLDRGAIIDTRDAMGRTALMYAAAGPYSQTVQLLLERGADLNIRGKEEGWTVLMFAAAEGQFDVIRVLLAHGADIKITDKDGDTALDFAVKNGHQEAAKILKTDFSFRSK
jgi:ankyrin repeat protein